MDGAGRLILKRQEGQTIVIEDVVIQVTACRNGYVQLAVVADRGVRVLRGEVFARLVQQGELSPIPNQEFVEA